MSKRPVVDSESQQLHEQPTKILKTARSRSTADDNDDQNQLPKLQSMLAWLQQLGGADWTNVRIAPSSNGGGFGAFCRFEIPPNGVIARIPNLAVMTIARSKRSRVGQCYQQLQAVAVAVAAGVGTKIVNQQPCPSEFLLWLDMVHGRKDSTHFHHPYLASLPNEAPDVPSWTPTSERKRRLHGTNLGTAADQAFQDLEDQYHRWMPQFKKINAELFGFMSLSDLVWARGMYFSRRFPTVLLQNDETDGETTTTTTTSSSSHKETESSSIGIMLPFFDLLNHSPHQPITWSGSKTHVIFSAGPHSSIPVGQEIYNNYGPKGNEMLMMMYGFALRNNCHDSYGLHLTKMTMIHDDDTTNHHGERKTARVEKTSLGTFQIHRSDSPIYPQFPPELWKALNQMFENDPDDDESSDHNNDDGTNNDDIAIGLEAIELLLDTFQQRLGPFQLTREVDSRLEDAVSIYRDGQRVVLEQAIETLQSMIPDDDEEVE